MAKRSRGKLYQVDIADFRRDRFAAHIIMARSAEAAVQRVVNKFQPRALLGLHVSCKGPA